MSKVSQYLNEHVLGEVIGDESVRERFSKDASVLTEKPELVVNPRLTNDIRKIARFTWQLAEKGHIMPMTVRGGGSDQTGAAIGKGIIINTMAHLNNIIFINLKDKSQFVHVQSGVNFGLLNSTLQSHGIFVPFYPTSANYSTVGGAVANNASGTLSGRYGYAGNYVSRLEVVLANGDIIETGPLSHHELDKKKGLQTLEGEIYRKIDGLIEDNEQLISDKISKKTNEHAGYSGIAKVKDRNKSFDLTPLFIGSQGTLGIISEVVMKTEFFNSDESIIIATFKTPESARDAADQIVELKPAILQVIDESIFDEAETHGKKYIISSSGSDKVSQILYISFNDFGAKQQHHKIKHALKKLSKFDATTFTTDDYSAEELRAALEVSCVTIQPEAAGTTMPSLIDGASIPADRREEYIAAMADLASKHHTTLPLQINWLNGVVHTRCPLQLHTITDKQKVFKLVNDYAELVTKFGGSMVAESGEGRLKSTACYAQLGADVISLYEQIRIVFDPYGTLNPGVKQPSDLKTLVAQLNPSYNLSDFTKYGPVN